MNHGELFAGRPSQLCGGIVARRPKASLCVVDAVDNGKLLGKTGLIWSIDGTAYQIVLVGTVGWAKPRNTRSSSVNYSNPIYVFLRSATLQGQVFKFGNLKRIVASVLFREGRARLKVHVPSIRTLCRKTS